MLQRTLIWVMALAALSVLGGCSTRQSLVRIVNEPEIGYLDGKFRVCRENCPRLTPKVLDDADYSVVQLPINIMKLPQPITQPGSDTQSAEDAKTFIVSFEFDKSVPNAEGLNTLQELLQAAQNATSLELLGGTDDIGSQDYNSRLAYRRAQFVAHWLKQHGVKTRISVEAKGACCHPSPYDKTETALQKMRRVKAKVQRSVRSVQPTKETEK